MSTVPVHVQIIMILQLCFFSSLTERYPLLAVFKLPALNMLRWEGKGLWEAEEHWGIICLILKTVYTGNTGPTPCPYLRILLRWSVRQREDKFSSLRWSIHLSREVKFQKVLPFKDLQDILDRHSLIHVYNLSKEVLHLTLRSLFNWQVINAFQSQMLCGISVTT